MLGPGEFLYWLSMSACVMFMLTLWWYTLVYMTSRAQAEAAVENQKSLNKMMEEVQKSFHYKMMNDHTVPLSMRQAYAQYTGVNLNQ